MNIDEFGGGSMEVYLNRAIHIQILMGGRWDEKAAVFEHFLTTSTTTNQ